jgi:hypothetical protein
MADEPQPDTPPPPPRDSRFPDTQAFLAVSVVYGVIGLVVLVIFHPPPQENASTIFTLIGSIIAFGGVVVGYYFGSSKGSVGKDDRQAANMTTLLNKVVSNGTGTGTPVAVRAAANAAAPAAAKAAAPAAATEAAPPAAAVAAPPAAEAAVAAALAERDHTVTS